MRAEPARRLSNVTARGWRGAALASGCECMQRLWRNRESHTQLAGVGEGSLGNRQCCTDIIMMLVPSRAGQLGVRSAELGSSQAP